MKNTALQQLRPIKKEIEILKQQIEELEYYEKQRFVTDSVKGSSKTFPFVEHSIMITGADSSGYFKKKYRLQERLSHKVSELMEEVENINKYIDTIDDSEIRSILQLRYINGLSWQQIAASLGTEGDGSTERKKHDRFLKLKGDDLLSKKEA